MAGKIDIDVNLGAVSAALPGLAAPSSTVEMPEGDTIWGAATMLRARLNGQLLDHAAPAPLRRLLGKRLIDVESVGKHLLMRFEGGLALHSHMRMTGAWHVYAAGERWHRPAHRVTAVLGFGGIEAVLFAAPLLEIVADDHQTVAHLGPDILDRDWDVSAVLARARSSLAPTAGELLLDQRVCAGIGNIHKCNALWQERIDPWTKPSALDDGSLQRLYQTARTRMRAGLAAGTGARAVGIHGRAGRPCPRCGAGIRVRAQGEHARLTFWCPGCQAARS